MKITLFDTVHVGEGFIEKRWHSARMRQQVGVGCDALTNARVALTLKLKTHKTFCYNVPNQNLVTSRELLPQAFQTSVGPAPNFDSLSSGQLLLTSFR